MAKVIRRVGDMGTKETMNRLADLARQVRVLQGEASTLVERHNRAVEKAAEGTEVPWEDATIWQDEDTGRYHCDNVRLSVALVG